MKLEGLVAGAADRLGASLQEEDGVFFLDVPVSDGGGEDDEDEDELESDEEDDDDPAEIRGQLVSVNLGVDSEIVYVRDSVGPFTDEVDLADLLRDLSSAVYARLYLDVDDDGVEMIVVEACAPTLHLTEEALAKLVLEVADRSEIIAREIEGDDTDDDED